MAATYNKFEDFVEQLGKGIHQLHTAGHQLECYLSNDTPDAALDAVKTDLAEITIQNGYTGPEDAIRIVGLILLVGGIVSSAIYLRKRHIGRRKIAQAVENFKQRNLEGR